MLQLCVWGVLVKTAFVDKQHFASKKKSGCPRKNHSIFTRKPVITLSLLHFPGIFVTSDVAQACQKSLDAAIRSKRANIAEALRAKLTKLEAERSPKSCETKRVPRKKKHAALENASEDSKTSKVKKAKNVKKVLKKNPSKQKCTLDDAKIDAVLFPDTTSTLKTVKHGSKSTKREPVRETPKRKKVKRKTQGSSGELPSDARATAIDLLLRAAAKAKAARQAAGEESEEEAPMPELPTPRSWGGWGGGNVQKQRRETGFTVMWAHVTVWRKLLPVGANVFWIFCECAPAQ